MGATLPTLTRFLTRDGSLSRAFGRLYAANTIGAIVGTLLAGLVLIELFGLSGALAVGAGCSAIAGIGGTLAVTRRPVQAVAPKPSEAEVEELVEAQERVGAQQSRRPTRTYQPSRPARPTRRQSDPARADGRVRLRPDVARLPGPVDAAARLGDGQHDVRVHGDPASCSSRPGDRGPAVQSPPARASRAPPGCWRSPRSWPARSSCSGCVACHRPSTGDRSAAADSRRSASWSFVAVPVVLLTTIVLGLSFPAASALLADDEAHTGRSAGTFLAVNTIGSITGSFVVPFVLIPLARLTTGGRPAGAGQRGRPAPTIALTSVDVRRVSPADHGARARRRGSRSSTAWVEPGHARSRRTRRDCRPSARRSSPPARTRSRRSRPGRSRSRPSCGSPARR